MPINNMLNTGTSFPSVDGTAGQVLKTDGAGSVTWEDNAGISYPGIYVSQVLGNNANSGTFSSPVATISYALSIATANTTIYVMDDATYTENLVVSLNFLNIRAGAANLVATSGDAITVTGNYTCGFIFNSITTATTTTNALKCVLYGNVSLKVTSYCIGHIETNEANVALDITSLQSNSFVPVQLNAFLGGSITGNVVMFSSGVIYTATGLAYILVNNMQNTGTGSLGPSLNNKSYLNSTVINPDLNSNLFCVDVGVSHTQLAAAGTRQLITPFNFTARYSIRSMVTTAGTNFAGGDRDIIITDGVVVYSTIPSAALLSLSNNTWGSVNLPFPVPPSKPNEKAAAGSGIYAEYSGGTTDYTSGSFTVVICAERFD